MPKAIDLTGQKFSRLYVVGLSDKKNTGGKLWECRCDCGNTSYVRGYALRSGRIRSCGCLQREWAVIHGKEHTHGLRHHPIYNVWADMIKRCEKPTESCYHNYGGRGIKVCEEWHDASTFFDWAFKNGYEKGLELDRIDVNGNYEPDNCRFVTHIENANNKRTNHYIEHNGMKKSIADWARYYNVTYSALNHHIQRNHTIEEALKRIKSYKVSLFGAE